MDDEFEETTPRIPTEKRRKSPDRKSTAKKPNDEVKDQFEAVSSPSEQN